ncbi:Nuclear control of ATPase protein 2 [Thoreauomyces humboldtii]|nr:Nuclear control of ATPase protein 2 [Thoreauomyces humboldtii]
MGFVSERLGSQLRSIDTIFHLDADHDDLAQTFNVLFGDNLLEAEGLADDASKPVQLLWEILTSQHLTVPRASKHSSDGELAEDHLPSLAVVGRQIDDLRTALHAEASSVTDPEVTLYPLAQLACLAKIAAVLHAHLLQRLLAASTTLPPDVAYWREQESSALRSSYYLLQTVPSRLFHYARILFVFMRAQQPSHLRPQFRMFSDRLSKRLKRNLTNSSSLISTTSSFLGITRARLHAPPTMFELARQEIRLNREKLENVRQTQAGCLGLLAEEDANTRSWRSSLTRASVEQTGDLADIREAADHVQSSLSMSLGLMEGVMERMTKVQGELSPEEDLLCTDVTDLEESVAAITPQTIPRLFQQAKSVHVSLRLLETSFLDLRRKHGRPSVYVRNWVPALVLALGTYQVGSTLAVRWEDVKHWADDFRETAASFFLEWIVKPLENVYTTVRHKEARLSISSGESLSADLKSLERMVVDYAKDTGVTNLTQLQHVAEQAQKGDLSVVLQRYAEEIKSPLKNAMSGDLIRALLIQIQKAKVDGELAIDALDKLLRSNELNFAFLAVTPSLLVSWLASKKISAVLSGGKEKTRANTYERIRASLRNIDRILNQSNRAVSAPAASSSGSTSHEHHHRATSQLTYKAHGLLLCEVYLLRKYVPQISRAQGFRQNFMEDLRELESGGEDCCGKIEEAAGVQWTVQQRMETVKRMWRTYPFLR